MRRKPMQNGGGQRHHNNGGQRRNHSGGGGGYSNNRPRKNYPQLREKYLNQAKDALSAGDRVMAEYYFQHADHCYRMMVEEGWKPRDNHQNENDQAAEQNQNVSPEQNNNNEQAPTSAEQVLSENNSALPSFLTMGYTAAAAVSNVEQAAQSPAQGDWEEN